MKIKLILTFSLLVNVVLISIFIAAFSPTKLKVSDSILSFSINGYVGDAKEDLIDVINQTENELNIAIYNIDDIDIANAILEASERGVIIKVLIDEQKATDDNMQEIIDDFNQEGISVKVNTDQKMHMKLTISDKKTIVTGSFNYTENSSEENQELLITIVNATFAQSMTEAFNDLWQENKLENWN